MTMIEESVSLLRFSAEEIRKRNQGKTYSARALACDDPQTKAFHAGAIDVVVSDKTAPLFDVVGIRGAADFGWGYLGDMPSALTRSILFDLGYEKVEPRVSDPVVTALYHEVENFPRQPIHWQLDAEPLAKWLVEADEARRQCREIPAAPEQSFGDDVVLEANTHKRILGLPEGKSMISSAFTPASLEVRQLVSPANGATAPVERFFMGVVGEDMNRTEAGVDYLTFDSTRLATSILRGEFLATREEAIALAPMVEPLTDAMRANPQGWVLNCAPLAQWFVDSRALVAQKRPVASVNMADMGFVAGSNRMHAGELTFELFEV